jgi:hypothetical protein
MRNPYFAATGSAGSSSGLVAATYHACPDRWSPFPQSFAFIDGRIRGCVPLDVKIAGQARIRHVTLALFVRCH